MGYMPALPGQEPVYNSDTDEVVHSIEGVASGVDANLAGVVLVPSQCTYMVFTVADIESATITPIDVFLSTDSADLNSGQVLENAGGGNRNLGIPVAPGITLFLHTVEGEVDINITRFYTKK